MVKYVVGALAIALLLLFFVVPFLTNYALQNGYHFKSLSRWLDVIQWLQTIAMHSFVYLWVTFLGSCFASFLNVVAWRVPRGRSILGSSHCPSCDAKLSLRDNVPIFGWLNNNGQCRSCDAPIAVRYLVVEMLLGLTFLGLFVVEVVFGGANLPLRPDLQHAGIEFLLFTPNWFLILTFIYHATLLCGLFTFALIASEHNHVPGSVIFFAAIFLVAIASTWPHVIQVPWTAGIDAVQDWPPERFSRTSLYTMAIGVVAGVLAGLIGWTIDVTLPSQVEGGRGPAIVASMALVGLALGWQSAIFVLALWCLGKLPFRTGLRSLFSNGCAIVMFATILHLLFWCWQMPINLWLNE